MRKIIKKIIKPHVRRYLRSLRLSTEEKELNEKRRELYMQFLKRGDVFFDVGSNYGNRILPIIKDGIKIVAVEPQEDCLNFLKLKFGNKITIIPTGLGSKEEEKVMHISNMNTLSSFSEDWIEATKNSGRFEQFNWETKKTIKLTTLDALIEKYGTPAFIKIDVEGFELEVLGGLTKNFNALSFEYTVPEQLDKAVACLDRLAEITNELEFNYSEGESTKLASSKWIDYIEMVELVRSSNFVETQFGDIYARKRA